MTPQSEVKHYQNPPSTRDPARADRTKVLDRRGIWAGRLIGGAIAAIGAVLAAGGLWLILLGGSLYYLMSGIGYVAVGVLLSRRRPAGALLAVALLAATLAWALWEAGLDYWALFPRVLLPAGLALLALLAALRFPANESRRVPPSVAGVLALAIAVEFAFAFVPHGAVHERAIPPVRACREIGTAVRLVFVRADQRGHALFTVHANQPRECRTSWSTSGPFARATTARARSRTRRCRSATTSTPARATGISRLSMQIRAQCAGATTSGSNLPPGPAAAVSATTSCPTRRARGRPP